MHSRWEQYQTLPADRRHCVVKRVSYSFVSCNGSLITRLLENVFEFLLQLREPVFDNFVVRFVTKLYPRLQLNIIILRLFLPGSAFLVTSGGGCDSFPRFFPAVFPWFGRLFQALGLV